MIGLPKAKRGRLVVLEGGEGAGKSTHAAFVRTWLEQRGRTVVSTREPGGTPLAEAIRKLVLERWEEGVSPMTELLLMFAARSAHVSGKIAPAMARGEDVVCDRFVDATYAYQGAGRGIPDRVITALAELVLGRLKPDLVLVLDIDPEVAAERVGRRGVLNRFDAETADFQRRVRRTYLKWANLSPRRYAVIDANGPVAEVQAQIAHALERKLE